MDKAFQFSVVEKNIAEFWDSEKVFEAKVDLKKTPFCIILPPPNANGCLHMGHAMFTYEDILIRYRKMMGDSTFWLLGLDHAGFETQYVFEKQLRKQGKSRFDYDRETLFKMIWDFVMENKNNIKNQLRRLGFGLDWSKETFTLDPKIVDIVNDTFIKLYDKGLLYRANRLVNYCTRDGTSFSDLEVNYVERVDPLYYIKYGPFTLATVRPETKFGDTGVAVNPKDKRYAKWVGKKITVEGVLGPFVVEVIADDLVDPEFGTGVVKVTPAHDFNDYEMGKRHNLPLKQVIDFNGRMNDLAGKYKGLKVQEARKQVVADMQAKGLIEKIDEKYTHRVGTCYKCGNVLEPLPKEQWFIKVKPLAQKSIELVRSNKIRVFPRRFKSQLMKILDQFIDWNISRQTVWGIRIPAYQCASTGQWFTAKDKPETCALCGKNDFTQDPDTFDTWFSSAQWPFATLQMLTQSTGENLYSYFYPTSVMETGHDILRAWVARMIMIGHFSTEKPPFETVLLHGMVRDAQGAKMSKSKGNVINPLIMVDKYGADALRAALIFGTKEGGDVSLSEQKVLGMRNFANKIWNIGRFIQMNKENEKANVAFDITQLEALKKDQKELRKTYLHLMKAMKFSAALDQVYHFVWHRLADYYIEQLKESLRNGSIEVREALEAAFDGNLKMLHPFMPFVTEAIWQATHSEKKSILEQSL